MKRETLEKRVSHQLNHWEKFKKYYDTFPNLGPPNNKFGKLKLAIKLAYLMDKPNPFIAMIKKK